jgi:hypothetical protein
VERHGRELEGQAGSDEDEADQGTEAEVDGARCCRAGRAQISNSSVPVKP